MVLLDWTANMLWGYYAIEVNQEQHKGQTNVSWLITNELEISFQFNKKLYTTDFIKKLGEHFKNIISKVGSNENSIVGEIDLF